MPTREIFSTTLAAQAAVLPMILFKMGDLSNVALAVNILVLPLIPATMFFGFVTGALGFASAFLSLPFAYISYLLLEYELQVVHFFSSLSFASLHLSYFPFWLMILCYVALLLFIAVFRDGARAAPPRLEGAHLLVSSFKPLFKSHRSGDDFEIKEITPSGKGERL